MNYILQTYWSTAQSLLVQFRAGAFNGSTDDLHAELLAEAQRIDANYRMSPYNLPSLHQNQINAIKGNTVRLATKWLNDGRPVVPAA